MVHSSDSEPNSGKGHSSSSSSSSSSDVDDEEEEDEEEEDDSSDHMKDLQSFTKEDV